MNFKFKTLSLLLAGAALGMTSCSDDMPSAGGSDNGPEASSKKYYVTAGIALPAGAGSRSQTDSTGVTNSDATPDYEYGYDYENDVRTMILLFAAPQDAGQDKFLCYSVVSGIEKAPTGSKYEFDVLAEVKYDDLKAAYDANVFGAGNEVNVYAFCNYTANLEEKLTALEPGDQTWMDLAGSVIEGPSGPGSTPAISSTIWASRSFLMTNYSTTTTKFPATINDWDDYADKNSPFLVTQDGDQSGKLLPIKVERSAARLDFKDGSGNDNKYFITTDVREVNPDEVDAEKELFGVQLTRMALVNMSNKFYYLRRVSDDGTSTGANFKYLGVEGTKNYVVDTDADAKNAKQIKALNAGANFNFCLYDDKGNYARNQWYIDNIKDVLADDKYNDTWEAVGGTGQYKIWRYVTENTIPGADNQITVQSTGIVFKGRIIAGDDINETYSTNDSLGRFENYVSQEVQDALTQAGVGNSLNAETAKDMPILYSFKGFLYAGYEELIKKAAKDGYGGTLFTAVNNILSNWKLVGTTYTYQGDGETALTVEAALAILDGTDTTNKYEITDAQIKGLAPKQMITVYEISNEEDGEGYGYYCYYFYWNRHNDNGKSGLMGPMEFATVRNNVYKLSVKSIGQLGHPTVKEDDPDPEEEDRDDEDPTRYIQVDVEVLPWVVRVNEIEF